MDTPGELPPQPPGLPGRVVDGCYEVVIGDYVITGHWLTIRSLATNRAYTFRPSRRIVRQYLRDCADRERRQEWIERRARGK